MHCTGVKIGYFTINNSNESTLRAFTQWYFRDGGRVESWWKMEQVIIMSIAFWDSVDRLIDFLSVDKDQIQTFNITITISHHHDIGLKFGFSILKGLFPEWGGRLTGSATDLKVGCKIWLGGCLLIFSSLAHMRWSSFCQIYGYIMREKKYQKQLNGKKNPVNNIIIISIIITNHNWKRGKISELHWQHFKRGPKWQSRNMSLYHQTRHHHQCHRHHCYQHHHHQQHCHQYQQYHHRQQQHPRK